MREAKPEIRAIQFVRADLQQASGGLERDERVLLELDTRLDVEPRKEGLRVGTELANEVPVSPQVRGANQADHPINSRVGK
jgi:hypothetical protein